MAESKDEMVEQWFGIMEVLGREILMLQAFIDGDTKAEEIEGMREEWQTELTDEERRRMGGLVGPVAAIVFPLVGAQVLEMQAVKARKRIAAGGTLKPDDLIEAAEEMRKRQEGVVPRAYDAFKQG